MKRYLLTLFVVLMCFGVAYAGGVSTKGGVSITGGVSVGTVIGTACTSETVDLWQDFEANADCTSAELAKSDHASVTWTLADASSTLTCNSVSATHNTIKCFDGSTTTSTKGMAQNLTAGALGYIQFDIGSDKTDCSTGFWFYAATIGTSTSAKIHRIVNSANSGIELTWIRAGGAPYLRAYGSAGVDTAMSADAWHWITFDYNQNGNSELKIYDTSGNLEATSSAIATGNYACRKVSFGSHGTPNAQAVTLYYDNMVVDWTDATYPLGP